MQQSLTLVGDIETNRYLAIERSTLSDDEQSSVIKLALEILQSRHQRGKALVSPELTKQYLQCLIGDHKNEEFGIIFLDNRNRVIATEILFHGTIDGASVYPRLVLARVLELNAAALIIFHNHPSQEVCPSQADKQITKRLTDTVKMIDVRIMDHFIVSVDDTYSFAEHGLI